MGALDVVDEEVRNHLQALGLNGYESRVLVALLKKGSATARELAELSGIGRTSIYPVLESLRLKNLAQPLAGKVVRWAASEGDDVLDRLSEAEHQRLRELQTAVEVKRRAASEAVKALGPTPTSLSALPFAQVLATVTEVKRAYDRLMHEAKDEALVIVAPPYSWDASRLNESAVDALGRGVTIRALYQASYIEDPAAQPVLAVLEDYLDAGLEARVGSDMPMKLAVYDRRAAIVVMLSGDSTTTGYPTSLLVEHAGLAGFLADAFERHWASAEPYRRHRRESGASGRRRGRSSAQGQAMVASMSSSKASEPASVRR